MKNFKFLLVLSAILLFSCKADEIELNKPDTQPETETISQDNPMVIKGVVRVKLSSEVGDNFSVTRSAEGELRSGSNNIDAYLKELGATEMHRVFPYAGKFEERTRKEGLHLWYDINFDETRSVTRAASDAKNIPGIDIVEEVYRPSLPQVKYYPALDVTTRAAAGPFNDPRTSDQWHYNNTGAISKSKVGADINLFKAWEKETGKPSVIVSIVDEGIDPTHEDLIDNLWINQAELNGEVGKDDDGNGYIDDIHGYNFVTNNGKVESGDIGHGTHVAGTVAARNNNGIGVAGIAGGDGTSGSGARLMSCQVFRNRRESGNFPAAIKYGADNGAVISQNSWGYDYPGPGSISSSMKAAIDYFIKYAGCDNDGEQLPNSPMKGGVVIFAAGNDGKDYLAFPGAYEPTIAVSSMSPSWEKAYYTNRGAWVDIMAPGGDEYYGNRGTVLSTMPEKLVASKYGYMQGTSMACPHVSGIAALVVSKFGGQGFSNKDLEKRLLTSLKPKVINAENPGFEGRLGRGYIDAAKTLAVNENKKPGNITAVTVKEDYTSLELTWKAVADADDGTADIYRITMQPKGETFSNEIDVLGGVYKPGENIIHTIENLPLDTQYDMTITAIDRWGLKSETYKFSAKTKKNNPPVLTATGNENIRIAENETAQVKIKVVEPDGQNWTYKVTGQQQGVSVRKQGDNIIVDIHVIAPVGKYTTKISVADIFDATASLEIPFEIYQNHPPKLTKEFKPLFIPLGKTDRKIDLTEYFTDEDGHTLNFTAKSSDASVLGVSLNGSVVTFNPQSTNPAIVNVSATDKFDTRATGSIQVYVVRDELVYIVYPIPASKVLHVRLSDEVSSASISVLSSIGQKVLSQNVTVSDDNRMVDLDISKLAGGSYMLHVEANGKTYKKSFVKH